MIGRVRTAIILTAWLVTTAPPVFAQTTGATIAPVLHDLHGAAELGSLFDGDRDKVRIVMLLSPT
jgi:hypothetical protein